MSDLPSFVSFCCLVHLCMYIIMYIGTANLDFLGTIIFHCTYTYMYTPAGHYYMMWIFLIPSVTHTVIISLMLNLVQESCIYI